MVSYFFHLYSYLLDCEIPSVFRQLIPSEKVEEFLQSPVWALSMGPRDTRMQLNTDNFVLQFGLPLEHCVSSVLKDNFTEPLIDVLLSYSPTSNINKTEDLNLIEILARHSFQRKGMLPRD